jgi:leader peptidase (prepilin peptidase)/N-methyltransferase
MHVVTTIAAAALGAAVGTLLPLPTYRLSVPAGSVPAADCRQCLLPLPAGVRGWIGRGNCPSCESPLTSSRWGYVAALAVAFALLAWRLPHRSPAEILLLAAWLVFAGAGVWLAAIDLHVHRLPTKIIIGAAATCGSLLVAAALVRNRPGLAVTAGTAAVVLGLAYLALAILAPGQLGVGDVHLAALCGLLLGAHGWGTVMLGAALPWLLSAIVAGTLLAIRLVRRDTLIPLGPHLVAGTLLAVVIGGSGG